jgi:uncharacterized membrane protein
MRLWPVFWAMVVAVVGLFVVIGQDSLAISSRSVLHGLCAQRPSHSFAVGGELLPFDSRMTGIYSGSLISFAVLAIRNRLLVSGTPSRGVIAVLFGAVALMGIDGVNALLVDLGAWHPYEPMNVLRFPTGFGAGVALATLEVWLVGSTLWHLSAPKAPWERVANLWWTAPAAALVLGFILADPGWAYPLLAIALVASAWITVTGLTLVIVISLVRVERRIVSLAHLEPPLVIAALLALLVIIGLAQLRFWLERTLGIPQDFMATAGTPLAAILSADVWNMPPGFRDRITQVRCGSFDTTGISNRESGGPGGRRSSASSC